MKRTFRNSIRVALVLAAFTLSGTAFAQATRTWVSGVGDDVNPCSRTAPCKTFAGAISKTAAGGEINIIDSGAYGTVTITKSITIDGGGNFASTLASGTYGMTINGAGIKVTIRNVSIHGGTTGLVGIRFLQGASLNVENVQIFNFTQQGILFTPSTTAELFVTDTSVYDIHTAVGGSVIIRPGAGASASGAIRRTRVTNNLFGIRVEDRSTISISDSEISGNTNNGLLVYTGPEAAQVTVSNSLISGNGGTAAHAGVKSSGIRSTVNISNNTITQNFVGLLPDAGGDIISLGNNTVIDNGTDGAPTSTVPTL